MPTFDTPEPILATIDFASSNVWVTGDIHITATDRADTVVDVQPRDPSADADVETARQTQVEYANGHLLVKAPRSRLRSMLGRGASVDVTVELPVGSGVEAKAAAGGFRCTGRLGDSKLTTSYGDIRIDQAGRLRASTSAGDVTVDRAVGHAEITTSNGDVRVRHVDGTAVVKTSDGDITTGEVTGVLRLTTANGDIDVDAALAGVTAKTSFGAIRIGGVVRGAVEVGTAAGTLEVGVREGTAAWLDANSRYGMVRSSLDACDGPDPSDDTVEVRARTGMGDIVVHRA